MSKMRLSSYITIFEVNEKRIATSGMILSDKVTQQLELELRTNILEEYPSAFNIHLLITYALPDFIESLKEEIFYL